MCSDDCPSFEIPEFSILIVHLGAMGAVLRSTALLRSIKRKYPKSFITWVTEENTKPLLWNNPLIDKILGLTTRDTLILSSMRFDIGFFIDKSPEVAGLAKLANPQECFGFTVAPQNGAIVPISKSAHPLWELGLSNQKKFFENKKTELSLIAEALELPYQRDEYIVCLSSDEKILSQKRRAEWSEFGKKILIGLNTGTSGVLPHKTISIEMWLEIIERTSAILQKNHIQYQWVLLGGGAVDNERNHQIINKAKGHGIIFSPATEGLRNGLSSVDAVDLVVTGDSLGMHMAIALQKQVIAWFGPTCDHEIDLFDRGIKIKSSMSCSPCWKRSCDQPIPCNQRLDIDSMTSNIIRNCLKLITKKEIDCDVSF